MVQQLYLFFWPNNLSEIPENFVPIDDTSQEPQLWIDLHSAPEPHNFYWGNKSHCYSVGFNNRNHAHYDRKGWALRFVNPHRHMR